MQPDRRCRTPAPVATAFTFIGHNRGHLARSGFEVSFTFVAFTGANGTLEHAPGYMPSSAITGSLSISDLELHRLRLVNHEPCGYCKVLSTYTCVDPRHLR